MVMDLHIALLLLLLKEDYYIAFREGMKHYGPDDFGVIKILISCSEVDLRDPCLSIMPDGKLLLSCGARMFSEKTWITKSYYAEETNTDVFNGPYEAELPPIPNSREDCWIWRLTWNKQVGYGVCYHSDGVGNNCEISLMKTLNGKLF